jgi:hypothetical protein
MLTIPQMLVRDIYELLLQNVFDSCIATPFIEKMIMIEK